jgi:hypothetical protein
MSEIECDNCGRPTHPQGGLCYDCGKAYIAAGKALLLQSAFRSVAIGILVACIDAAESALLDGHYGGELTTDVAKALDILSDSKAGGGTPDASQNA